MSQANAFPSEETSPAILIKDGIAGTVRYNKRIDRCAPTAISASRTASLTCVKSNKYLVESWRLNISATTPKMLKLAPTGKQSETYGTNERGDIVGYYAASNWWRIPCLWWRKCCQSARAV